MKTYRLHKTITGEPLSIPIEAEGDWSNTLTGVGEGTFTVNLAGLPFTAAQLRDGFAHWARTLVVSVDGTPQYAGLIEDWDEDVEGETVTLTTRTIDVMFDSRYPFGVGGYESATAFSIASASLRSAFERTVNAVTVGKGGSWDVPFTFSNLGESGGFSETWPVADWDKSGDILDFIQELTGGPDAAFVPVYTAGGWLQWNVLTGAPRITGPVIDLPLSVRGSRASGLRIRDHGASMVSGVFARGEGFGEDRKVGLAGYFDGSPDGAPPMIVRDVAVDHVAVKKQTRLDSLAAQYLAENTWPVTQYEFALNVEERDGTPSFPVADLRLGARLNARFSGSKLHDPFTKTLYVVGVRNDSGSPETYRVEVQEL